jgi:hypothetical protein
VLLYCRYNTQSKSVVCLIVVHCYMLVIDIHTKDSANFKQLKHTKRIQFFWQNRTKLCHQILSTKMAQQFRRVYDTYDKNFKLLLFILLKLYNMS